MPPRLQQILDLIRDRWDRHNQPTTQKQIMAATGLSQSLVSHYTMELRARYDQIGCTGRTVNSTVYYFPIDDLRPEDVRDRRNRLIHRLKASRSGMSPDRLHYLCGHSSPVAEPGVPARPESATPPVHGGTKGGSESDVAPHGHTLFTPSIRDFVQWGTDRYQIQNIISKTDEAVLVVTQEGTFRITDRASVPHPDLKHLRIFTPDRRLAK